MLGVEGGQGLGPGYHLCGPGGVSGMYCRKENRKKTWETANLGQVLLLLLIKFVSWGKWPHHSERLSFSKGRVKFCGVWSWYRLEALFKQKNTKL